MFFLLIKRTAQKEMPIFFTEHQYVLIWCLEPLQLPYEPEGSIVDLLKMLEWEVRKDLGL